MKNANELSSGHHSSQKLIFFTGKGGVGKSILSSAKALSLQQQGSSVLHIEIGSAQFLKTLYNKDVQQTPMLIKKNLYASSFNTTDCIKEFIRFYLKSDKVASVFTDNALIQNIISSAPGLSDLTLLGKVTSGIVKIGPPLDFDYLVIDSYSTGHFKALIRAATSMAESFKTGPVGNQSRSMVNVLKRKDLVEFNLIGNPEQLSFEEVKDLQDFLKKSLERNSNVILNKVMLEECDLSSLPEVYKKMPLHKKFIEQLEQIDFWQKKYFLEFSAQAVPWIVTENLKSLIEKISIQLREVQ